MKILVCIKQVPDPESRFEASDTSAGYREDKLVFRANDYDEYALEEAAKICETTPASEFTALTVGPARAANAARRGIEFGAKSAAHIVTASSRIDAISTAKLIADFARDKNFDLYFFGVMSTDEQRSAVGPMTAALLGVPCAAAVVNLKIDIGKNTAVAERELERGAREIVELPLPAAITFQSGVNRPRYPNLTNKLRARSQELIAIDADAQGEIARSKIYPPPPAPTGVFIEGDIDEQAIQLVKIIRDKTGLI